MPRYFPKDPLSLKQLVDCYPLCWVVSGTAADRHATPLPLLAETAANGAIVSLLGHIARSNPHQNALERDPRATILCMGPQGYVSPQLVSNPTWGPTWNYAICRFETDVRFVPEENDAALHRLAIALEGSTEESWKPSRMGDRYERLKEHIVAFRATVLETLPCFKLGQDEDALTFDEIVGGSGDSTLANWMKRER